METEARLPSGKLVSELKVKDLQRELQKRRLPAVGKKADLSARLAEFLSKSERNQGDLEEEYVGANTSDDSTHPAEVPCEKPASKRGKEKGKKSKRRSHTRLNETFDYVEEEDPTQRNATVTPQGNSASSLVDACHRKSSRQSKERQWGGDGLDSPSAGTVRAQTPRSSKKVHRRTRERAEFLTDDEPEDRFQEEHDVCSDCIEKENALSHSHIAEASAGFQEKAKTPLTAKDKRTPVLSKTCSYSIIKGSSTTPKELGGFPSTPVSSSARGFSVSTASSAVRSANHKSSSRAKQARTVLEGVHPSSRSIKRRSRGNASEVFARQHARLFAQMETIGDRQERVARRHEENMQSVPNAVKRLATPKSFRNPARNPLSETTSGTCSKKHGLAFDVTKAKTTVTETSFNFGKVDDFSAKAKQGSSGTVVTSFSLKPSKVRDQRDVKSRTKQDSQQNAKKRLISVTVPIERPSINLLATPKGMIPNRARTKVSYTPHRGAVTFVDTTKLSDREFELAVANGLIKARSGRSSTQMETSRRTRRDDILDVQRKLKIVQ